MALTSNSTSSLRNTNVKIEDKRRGLTLTASNLSDLFKIADRTGFGVGVHEQGEGNERLLSEGTQRSPGIEGNLLRPATPQVIEQGESPTPEPTEQERYDKEIAGKTRLISDLLFKIENGMITGPSQVTAPGKPTEDEFGNTINPDPKITAEMIKSARLAITNINESMKRIPTPGQREKAGADLAGVRARTKYTEKQTENIVPAQTEEQKLKAKEDVLRQKLEIEKEFKEGKAMNFKLRNNVIVLSYDGGRTYMKDGENIPMPDDAVVIPTGSTMSEINLIQAKEEAGKEKKAKPEISQRGTSVEDAARGGTGPYSKIAAFLDSTVGGVFNIELFPETQENRQTLRLIKQIGKGALMNSSRGAIWEQQKIDQLFPDPSDFFTNPQTEAKKFKALREVLGLEKDFNNKAISIAITPKEAEKLRQSNQDIDRLLAIIGDGKEASSDTTTVTMPDGSIQVFDKSGKRVK